MFDRDAAVEAAAARGIVIGAAVQWRDRSWIVSEFCSAGPESGVRLVGLDGRGVPAHWSPGWPPASALKLEERA